MVDNEKADYRKITGAVEDAVTYPILTRDVTSPPSDGTSVPGPSGGASLDSIAQGTIRQLLGWRYRADDTTGFLAALNKTIQLKEVEGHIEWNVQPQSYMVQADLGQVTGAQASIYARAQVALDQSLPLLNGLTLLGVPTADPEDMEAIRAIIQTELTALVNELGMVGGPRVQRIDSYFSQLLGPPPIAPIPLSVSDPPSVSDDTTIQLVTLAYRFGLTRTNVNTIDDEQDFTNYLVLYDYIYSLYQTWQNQRGYFTGRGRPEGGPYLGTQLVLISQALDALEESVQEAYDAMDSVFFGASDRQATQLHLYSQPLITVAELFGWVEDFATNEGLQLIQEGGADGVVAFRSTINQLEYLMFLTMTESRAHSRNPVHGFHTARVYRSLENVQKYLHVTEREADKIQRDSAPPPPSILPMWQPPIPSGDFSEGVRINLAGANVPTTSTLQKQNAPHPKVWIISKEKPVFGIEGYVEGIVSNSPTSTITAIFTYKDSEPGFKIPLGEYLVAIQNPDGRYGWLEDAITIISDSEKDSGEKVLSAAALEARALPAPQVVVTDVVGLTEANAEASIQRANLQVGYRTRQHSTTSPLDTVISQSPAGGSFAAPDSAVSLVISSGPPPQESQVTPPQVTVPNVVGLAEANAEASIQRANLQVGHRTRQHSTTSPVDTVISQSPAGGSFAAPDSAVSLVISSGLPQVRMLDVAGMTQADAVAAIWSSNLAVGPSTQQSSTTVPAGSVISQNPVGGSYAAPGSAVNLVISSGPPQVTIPDVVGMTQANAELAIRSVGLAVSPITQQPNTWMPGGSVISQNPAGGTFAAQGSAVSLVISSGPPQVTIPDVAGMTQADAVAAIWSSNLAVGPSTQQSSTTVPAGSVISQNPVGGTFAAPGSAVSLVISSGPPQVTIPDVAGMTQADAVAAIWSGNLAVGPSTQQSNTTVPAGSVISQNPVGGSYAAPGSVVSLVISSGPPQVTMLDVAGMTQANAELAIRSVGLAVSPSTQQSSTTVPAGSVISQNPAGGTFAAQGSAVSLVISSGPPQVTIPDVAGMTQADAVAAIWSSNLAVGPSTQQSSATVPAGSVISQNPVGGTFAAPGSAVSLVISSGPPQVTIPDVAGMTQADAVAAIWSGNLAVGPSTQQSSTKLPAGSVISQNPVGGSYAAPGSVVSLVISSGPPQVTMLDVAGMTQANAELAIRSVGLAVSPSTQQSSTTVPAGSVISQNPAGGTFAAQGSAVSLVISSGPPQVTIPDVASMTQADAVAAIWSSNLAVGPSTQQSSTTVPAGSVISQNPVGGSYAPPGSVVSLVISSGPPQVTVLGRPKPKRTRSSRG